MILTFSSLVLALSILAGIIILILGFCVYISNRKIFINKLFSLLVSWVAIWILGVIIRFYSNEQYIILISARLTFAAAIFIGFFLFYFSYYFPKKNRYEVRFLFLTGVTLVIFYLCLFTPYVVKSIELINGDQRDTYSYGYWFFVLTFLIYFGLSFYNLLSKRKYLNYEEITQTNYILAGLTIATVLAFSTNVIVPTVTGITYLAKFSPFAIIFFILFTTYAITKHHLFNIRVIATELLVGLVSLVLMIELLLSRSASVLLLKLSIFIAFVYLGISLIKSVSKEIKRRKELEILTSQLEKANIQLKKLDKAKSEFISIASHQLRTPLTAIKGYISMIMEGTYGKMREKEKQPMKNVYQANARLIKLVNDLLSISRIESGKLEMNWEPFCLEEIVKNIINEFKFEAKKKHLYIKWKKPPTPLPAIKVDKDKMRQVILNIIDNSIRYTEKGGITIEIKNDKNFLTIIVSDTGEGMTKNEIECLFNSFSRGKAGNRMWNEGVGLGLYIAKKFTQMHYGKIWAKSKGKKQGSAFYIRLPKK